MANFQYENTNVVVRNQITYNSCHSNVIQKTGKVEKEKCFKCYFKNEQLSKYENVSFMHMT